MQKRFNTGSGIFLVINLKWCINSSGELALLYDASKSGGNHRSGRCRGLDGVAKLGWPKTPRRRSRIFQSAGGWPKILFLDLDGVLNSTHWAGQRPIRGLLSPELASQALDEERLDPVRVDRLQRLLLLPWLAPGEWDPGWHVLKALEKLRLVRNIGFPRASRLRDDLVKAPLVVGLTEASLAGLNR